MRKEHLPSINDFEPSLLDGLREPTKDLLVQMLLYKSTFTGRTFRMLAEREPPEVRDALLLISRETLTETAAMAIRMRQWDEHPVSGDALTDNADKMRRRLLGDFLILKEGMTEAGLLIAMRAPNDELRTHMLRLTDVDRRHADTIRGLLGALPAKAYLHAPDPVAEAQPLGAAGGRGGEHSLSAAIEATLRELRARGGVPTRITLSAESLRHLRDEGSLDPETGQAFGLYLELDMGWRGECYAVSTQERVGYAEILTATRAEAEPAGSR